MSLKDTVTGRIMLARLRARYGTDDPDLLLEVVVVNHFRDIFDDDDVQAMTRTLRAGLGQPVDERRT